MDSGSEGRQGEPLHGGWLPPVPPSDNGHPTIRHEPWPARPAGQADGWLTPAPATAGTGGWQPEPEQQRPVWRRLIAPLGAVLLLLLKFGAKLKGVLLVLPKLKILTTSGSMLVSIAAYSLIWGWKFALGLVLLLFVHEMGHVIQLRREGIPASAPMFIPFLGAAVAMKKMPDDAAAEARVGLAGPILGTIGCLIPVAIWQATGSELFQAIAFIGFFLNLFNLMPVLPLDGGRAMAALTPVMWIVGFGMLIAAAFFFPSPIMLLIILFGGFETWRRWKARKTEEFKRFHTVTRKTRFAVAAVYLGLAIALAVGMDATFLERDLSDV